MSEKDDLFTCEICGEGRMSETAMQTHMFIAHVYNEVCCMFCDLRGVSAEEMTIHINSVHCSDNSHGDSASHNGLQQHMKSEKSDSENLTINQIQTTRVPFDRQSFVHSVDSNAESGYTVKPHASNVLSAPNYNAPTGSQQVLNLESPVNVCKINVDKQQKRKLSGTTVASSGQEKTDSLPVCVSSYNGAEVTTNCCTSLCSSSLSLPKATVANGVDQACHGVRFVECPIVNDTLTTLCYCSVS